MAVLRQAPAGAARRRYEAAFKRAAVEETLRPGASVAEVARRHGLNANLLFNWRRRYLAAPAKPAAALVAVRVVAPEPAPVPAAVAASVPTAPAEGLIELTLAGVPVRIRGAVDEATLRALVAALRG